MSDLFVIADDHHLAEPSEDPLTPIAELLPRSHAIGLHLIVALTTSGAAHAMYGPVLSDLKAVGSASLIMSGKKEEGRIFGDVRPRTLPAGRGIYVTRTTEPRLIQTARLDEGR